MECRLVCLLAPLRQLRSSDPQEAAWGAFRVAEDRVEEAAALVVERLRSEAERPEIARSFPLCAALLDALIVLDP